MASIVKGRFLRTSCWALANGCNMPYGRCTLPAGEALFGMPAEVGVLLYTDPDCTLAMAVSACTSTLMFCEGLSREREPAAGSTSATSPQELSQSELNLISWQRCRPGFHQE